MKKLIDVFNSLKTYKIIFFNFTNINLFLENFNQKIFFIYKFKCLILFYLYSKIFI